MKVASSTMTMIRFSYNDEITIDISFREVLTRLTNSVYLGNRRTTMEFDGIIEIIRHLGVNDVIRHSTEEDTIHLSYENQDLLIEHPLCGEGLYDYIYGCGCLEDCRYYWTDKSMKGPKGRYIVKDGVTFLVGRGLPRIVEEGKFITDLPTLARWIKKRMGLSASNQYVTIGSGDCQVVSGCIRLNVNWTEILSSISSPRLKRKFIDCEILRCNLPGDYYFQVNVDMGNYYLYGTGLLTQLLTEKKQKFKRKELIALDRVYVDVVYMRRNMDRRANNVYIQANSEIQKSVYYESSRRSLGTLLFDVNSYNYVMNQLL